MKRDQTVITQDLASPALAWDSYGRRFGVSETAAWWRVSRKGRKGGRPKPINKASGPLHIDILADFGALREAVDDVPGWYVLNAVDYSYAPIADIPAAHVEVVPDVGCDSLALDADPSDSGAVAIQRLTEALQQSIAASAQREQAMLSVFTEMATNVYAGFAQMQQSTAAMITAVQGGYDIAAGVSLQKLPPAPETPGAPPQKTFLEFLCSPAGNSAISALGSVLKSAVDDK